MLCGVGYTHKRKIADNTVQYKQSSGEVKIRYYRTDIVTYHKNGTISLHTDGYWQHSTIQRINNHLVGLGYICSRRGKHLYYCIENGKTYHYKEGMKIYQNGLPLKSSKLKEYAPKVRTLLNTKW